MACVSRFVTRIRKVLGTADVKVLAISCENAWRIRKCMLSATSNECEHVKQLDRSQQYHTSIGAARWRAVDLYVAISI